MALKEFLMIGAVVAVLAACGDDSSSNSASNSDEDSSSSICEDCDCSSSSKVKSSSSSAESSSSAASSSSKDVEPVETSSSSSSVDSSSSSAMSSSSDGSSSSVRIVSSSSSVKSSSSMDIESSSSEIDPAALCKTETEDNCEYGTLTDDRDGQTYKTVKIGTQTWMAQNLNYAYLQPTAKLDSSSFCYNDSVSFCEKYGRLYMWSAAMDSAGLFSEDGKGCGWHSDCPPTDTVRGVCPEGWHLPNLAEFQVLIEAVGGSDSAGLKLKSASGWGKKGDGTSGNGIDAFGFAALSAGAMVKLTNIKFEELGSGTNFWGSTESKRNMYLGRDYDDATLYGNFEDLGFSVRCVKD